jgi:tyrosyl-tRNA synthetase
VHTSEKRIRLLSFFWRNLAACENKYIIVFCNPLTNAPNSTVDDIERRHFANQAGSVEMFARHRIASAIRKKVLSKRSSLLGFFGL